MVRGIANSKIGFGDLILLLRYFFKLKVATHPKFIEKNILAKYAEDQIHSNNFTIQNNFYKLDSQYNYFRCQA